MDRLLNRAARRRHSGQRGFTLIELLVVIAVLAILAAIVVFNVTGVSDKGKTSACKTDLHSAQTAADAFYNANNGTYAKQWSDLVPAFLHTQPSDLGTVTWPLAANGGNLSSDQC